MPPIVDGIPVYRAPTFDEAPVTRPEAADIILESSGAVIRSGDDRAFYSPATGHIQLPPEQAFRGPPEFAVTPLHEPGHWTFAASRLNRDMRSRFGPAAYSANCPSVHGSQRGQTGGRDGQSACLHNTLQLKNRSARTEKRTLN